MRQIVFDSNPPGALGIAKPVPVEGGGDDEPEEQEDLLEQINE